LPLGKVKNSFSCFGPPLDRWSGSAVLQKQRHRGASGIIIRDFRFSVFGRDGDDLRARRSFRKAKSRLDRQYVAFGGRFQSVEVAGLSADSSNQKEHGEQSSLHFFYYIKASTADRQSRR